ncbi:MAG: molecular chaperone DnaJ [Hyphomicrobiales bacterium]|nr:MAG: molecular chaperone DnaJ [Hyphomicrobiales bacterium]
MSDPYKVLGLDKTASPAEIKKAYRGLAKKYHPDTSGDDKSAADKFAEISTAYELLGDKDKRAQYDRGEIDEKGNSRFHPGMGGMGGMGGHPFGAGGGGHPFGGGGFSAEDLFSGIFGAGQRGGAGMRMKGQDRHYSLKVNLLDTVSGATRRLNLPTGQTLDVRIPPGVEDGQIIRLKGQGEAGLGGGPAGDAMVTVEVLPDPLFQREGDNLRLELPITLYEAVLGGKVRAPVPGGSVQLTIPPGSSGGKTLRLKGKGVQPKTRPAGDLLVKLRIELPNETDEKLDELMRRHRDENPYNPRGGAYDR